MLSDVSAAVARRHRRRACPTAAGAVETVLADVSDLDAGRSRGRAGGRALRPPRRARSATPACSRPTAASTTCRPRTGSAPSGSTCSAPSTASRAAVAVMRPQGSGSIVLTASVSGLTAWSHAAPVLRHQGGGDPAREGRGGRVRPRRHPGELRVPGHVPLGHPRRPARRRPSTPIAAPAPPRARRGRRPRRRLLVPRRRRVPLDDGLRHRRRRRLLRRPDRSALGDAVHEDVGERLGHVPRPTAARRPSATGTCSCACRARPWP